MIWLLASLLLGGAAVYAVWPLVRHWQAPTEPPPPAQSVEAALEDLDLEVAAGRLSEAEATAQRQELRQ